MAKQTAKKDEPITVEVSVLTLTGKFQCTIAQEIKDAEENILSVRATLMPNTGESLDGSGHGNESWSSETPNGVFSLAITNQELMDKEFFKAGQHYAVTITAINPVEAPLDLQN